ncbi:MAG: magnesium transporter [Vibrionaceae bacterium]|nr:magnesium transporter [Vibrionaceae bacterium]
MEKAEFIQQHLIEKDVPADLTKPTIFVWFKYKDPSKIPLVFQSPVKVFSMHFLFMGPIWGVLMWTFSWRTEPEHWRIYLVASALFGICMGLINMFRINKARKRLGEKSWENWCRRNYE